MEAPPRWLTFLCDFPNAAFPPSALQISCLSPRFGSVTVRNQAPAINLGNQLTPPWLTFLTGFPQFGVSILSAPPECELFAAVLTDVDNFTGKPDIENVQEKWKSCYHWKK
jgi:hypothetical protein